MSKKRTNYDRLDAALAGIGTLTTKVDSLLHTVDVQSDRIESQMAKIDAQNIKIEAQTKTIEAQNIKIEAQTKTIEAQNIKIEAQTKTIEAQKIKIDDLMSRIETLEAENLVLKQRLTKIEDRLALLDHQLANLAPTVRSLLEDEHNILLDQDYRLIRDNEPADVFSSSRDLIVSNNLDTSSYPTGLQGASQEIGKSLAKFYRLVLGYSPRLIKSRNMYWSDIENPVIDPHVRLSKSLNLA